MKSFLISYKYPSETLATLARGAFLLEAKDSKEAVLTCLQLHPGAQIIEVKELQEEQKNNEDG